MIIKQGIAVSSGIAIGKCYPVDRNKVFISAQRIKDVEGEIAKLKAAVSCTSDSIENLKYSNIVGKVNRELYEAYKLLLEDELFIGEAEAIVRKEKVNAEYALKKVRDNIISSMSASNSDYIRERVYDIDHIYQRMQRHMSNIGYDEFDDAGPEDIIISNDVTPSDIEIMTKKGIKGYATNLGGKHSHNSIVARAAGLISVIGLRDVYNSVKKGDDIIIDSFLGQIIINPDEKTFKHYEKRRDDYINFIFACNKMKNCSCHTADGTDVNMYANVENNDELTLIDVYGLKGVGLYRTEFVYMNNPDISEESQYKTYLDAAQKLQGKEFTIRTFDFGGDKVGKYIPQNKEDNPAMGLRAIRYCLKNQDFFKEQLRAILRVAYDHQLKLLLPMVSSPDELIAVKELIEAESHVLEKEGIKYNKHIKIGIMVELPSAAISLEKFAPHADFFSIGTNDLIQYILGVDRNNPDVNHLYSPVHHSVIAILAHIYKTAYNHGKDVSLCGEIAGDSRYLPMLLGLGFRSFSMSPRTSFMARKTISSLNVKNCETLTEQIINAATMQEAENIIASFNAEYLKETVV